MYRLPRLALPVMLLMLTACGTTVNVDYDQATDFRALKTFNLITTPIKIADDPRLDSPLMQQRVVSAIQSAFTSKGLRPDSGQPDVRISYRIDVKQEIESDPSGARACVPIPDSLTCASATGSMSNRKSKVILPVLRSESAPSAEMSASGLVTAFRPLTSNPMTG